ncbi:MAG: histidine kinase [Ruminococcus sp.]|nr:histidine kinase [Ruminococcus sp.]
MIEFLSSYCAENFIALTIISALIAVMAVNRNEDIPAAGLFRVGAGLMLFVTVLDTFEVWLSIRQGSVEELADVVMLRTYCSALIYILRPVIIMTEVFLLIPDKRHRPICALPAVINGVYFSTAFFGIKYAFYITPQNTWESDGHNIPVYITQMIYLVLLAVFSFYFFKHSGRRHGAVILVICIQSVTVAVLEYFNIIIGCVNAVTALCILEYYIYLTHIYRQEIKDSLMQSKVEAAKNELLTLRNQIQPHFIYNSLSIIRSLARRDSELAVECIDCFSDYLKAHIGALKSADLIPFKDEVENVKIYLSLVMIDYENRLAINYELDVMDFLIPPLSLEPIVENAVEHGIGSGAGTITIKSYEQGENIYILIADSGGAPGSSSPDSSDSPDSPGHNGIGLENTRKRLEMQCGGSLDVVITEGGARATVCLPRKAGAKI